MLTPKKIIILSASLAVILILIGVWMWRSKSSKPVALQKSQPAPTAEDAFQRDLSEMVRAYRKLIVLMEDESAVDETQEARVSVVGKILFQENHERLSKLSDQLTEEIRNAGASQFAVQPPTCEKFLGQLEANTDLHDADKLVFRDVLEDLNQALRESKAQQAGKEKLQARVEGDLQSLREIQSLYDKELEKIFARFETRGLAVRREAWEKYVAFLKTRFNRDAILKEYDEATRSITESRQRGPMKRDSKLEVFGRNLPPKTLVLTFDDGPHPRYTDQVLDILKKYGVHSVFFEVGRNLGTIRPNHSIQQTRAATASRHVLESGSSLANHTYSHAMLSKLSDKEVAEEIESTSRLLQEVSHASPTLFRPPYGAETEKVLAAVESRKMKEVLWNIDSKDWADPIPKSIANRVIRQVDAEGRGIILFHDIHGRTIEALPDVLETLKKEGYRFLSWDGKGFVEDATTEKRVEQETVPVPNLYRESWAVIIGIDDYQNWPKLRYAVNDANGIKEILTRKYRFKPENIVTLLNGEATRERILSVLGDTMANPDKVKRDDRVVVFFAGHGITRKLPNGRNLGYIVPMEADVQSYQGQSISMTNFQDISEAIPAKHIFFVMDSCYSGLALTRGMGAAPASTENFLKEMGRRLARQMLTAGGADQQVADNGPNGHSVFTWTLMQGLEGRADLNGDGFITASELAAYVGPIVSSLSHQTPAFGNLPGSEGGEVVFELKHENEFLSELSTQLNEESIQINSELDRVRKEIADKSSRNRQLKKDLAAAQLTLAKLNGGRNVSRASSPSENSRTHNDRGMALFKEKKYQDALQEFMAATKLDPSNALAANNVGYMYYKLEQFKEAASWFEKAIALDPRRAIAYANLGDTYLKMERKIEAKSAFEKYLEILPSSKYAEAVRNKMNQLN
ncbi:MAG: polysaccharide deacetylase family protein [Acidobacteriia bacterium]|nr:polysaccharide deacetylase family protein [Terriglobia bacterium]